LPALRASSEYVVFGVDRLAPYQPRLLQATCQAESFECLTFNNKAENSDALHGTVGGFSPIEGFSQT
jgi:hypothetical protein